METPPSPESLALNAASCVSSGETIVHLLFRESVTPVGGVLHLIAKSEGQGGVHSPEHLESMGYIVRDGSVVTVDDVPVGRAYEALQYWGGEKQHKRWHLSEPVSVNPSRNGRPLFMDEGMVAFSATWKDGAKAEEALLDLLDLFISGPRNEGRIATPVAMRIIPVNKA